MSFIDVLEQLMSVKIVQVILIVLIAIIMQIVTRVIIGYSVKRALRRHSSSIEQEERKRRDTLVGAFRTLSGTVIWVAVVIAVLTLLAVDLAPYLTSAGLLGIIIGFGAQNTIKDFLAGIFIITENQYRVGDIVRLNAGGQDVAGVVEDLTIRITRLRDLDGNLHVVKNGSAEIATNFSFRYANVNVNLDVSYDADIDLVEKVINQVGQTMIEDEALKVHIYEPIQFLRVDSFESSSVRVKALGKVEPAKQWDISGEFLRRIKVAFKHNNIEIPFNRHIVQLPTERSRA